MKPKSTQPWIDKSGQDSSAVAGDVALGMDRRGFLKALGIGGVSALAACERLPVRNAIPFLVAPEEATPGVSIHYASTCAACPAACGLMVTVRDGRPIKLEGHKDHLTSAGGLCATGQADLRGLYDSGRLQNPTIDNASATWAELDTQIAAKLAEIKNSGQPVYVISTTLVSPTARNTIAKFLASYGGELVEYDAGIESASSVEAAYTHLDGRGVVPSVEIAASDLLVVFGADLLGAGSDPVSFTAQYSERRRQREVGKDFRHIQIEGNLSLTGAASDERIQATSSERKLMTLQLLKTVSETASGTAATLSREITADLPTEQPHAAEIKALATDLSRSKGRSLVVSVADDPQEQLATALINRILGSEGKTLNLARPSLVRRGSVEKLSQFTKALKSGNVGGVIIVGQNPVENLPDGESYSALLSGLSLSVCITDRPTATAQACKYVAASHHGLECWGDASPRADILTLMQPTMRPLFDTRHPIENILFWAGATETDYRLHLMETWRKEVFPASGTQRFTTFWNSSVSQGGVLGEVALRSGRFTASVLGGGKHQPISTEVSLSPSSEDRLEIELLSEVALRDGSSGFNPWLRELPEPLTRTSWVATARIAPSLAKSRGIEDGDVISITAGDTSLKLPARILPGQHPRLIGVPVGYGQKDGDGGDASRNGFRLGSASALPAIIERTGETTKIPLMQVHSKSEGRPIIHQVTAPDEAVHTPHHAGGGSLWEIRDYSPHWHMVIDLDVCIGCAGCVVACQAENNIPVVGPEDMTDHRDMHWLRIDRYFDGDEDDPEVLFEPMLCAQCDNAPCETVCPVAATVHSEDGLNQQAYNRCVGTRYCANNCPYKVRRFNWFDYTPKDPVERMVLNPDVVVRERGIMEKCTFCVQRIQSARIDAKTAGNPDSFEVQTACQQSCPAQAISFGDDSVKDTGPIDALKKKPRAFQVLADLGIEPSVTYLARVRRRVDDHHGESG